MNYQRRRIILWLSLILMLVVTLSAFVSCWGSPTLKLIVENQSEYNLTIYNNDYEIGNVGPGEQITDIRVPWDIGKYHIEAKNAQGEIIFSKTLTRAQMQKIKSRV